MKHKILRAGVIGAGGIGKKHMTFYRTVKGVELVALCDPQESAAAEAAALHDVKAVYSDYHALLKQSDLDIVSICTPNAYHAEIAIAALQAGKHVLLEKPMAINAQQAQRLIDAHRASDRILQVAMVLRQLPEAIVLKEYVDKGYLGTIYHARAVMTRRRGIPGLGKWFTTMAQSGGGAMIDLGVHYLDLCMYLGNLWEPTAVCAKTYAALGPSMKDYKYLSMWGGPPNHQGVFDVDDYACGMVRFGKQATLSFEISWAGNAQEECFMQIMGDKGGARIDGSGKLTIHTELEGRLADLSPQIAHHDPFERQIECFVAACKGQGPVPATPHQGLTLMRLLEGAYASSVRNAEVILDSEETSCRKNILGTDEKTELIQPTPMRLA